jgi:transposase-like protein
MADPSSRLTALSEAERTQALECFTLLRPALEEGVSQAQIADTHKISLCAVQRWMKCYREQGLAGMAGAARQGDA